MPPTTKRSSSTGKAIKRPVGRPSGSSKPAGARSERASGRIAAGAPKQSKDDLRARVEKLERANTTLRIKNRAMLSTLHDSSDRVAELEAEVAELRRKSAAAGALPTAGKSGRGVSENGADKTARSRRASKTTRSGNRQSGVSASPQDE